MTVLFQISAQGLKGEPASFITITREVGAKSSIQWVFNKDLKDLFFNYFSGIVGFAHTGSTCIQSSIDFIVRPCSQTKLNKSLGNKVILLKKKIIKGLLLNRRL